MIRMFAAGLAALALSTSAHAGDWRKPDPAELLVIETSKGVILVEMRPDMAPKAVERIKLLAREGVYDGLQFHRVIANFVDQTGNPNNKDGGVSRHPDLAPEFSFRLKATDPHVIVARGSDAVEGFVGATPFIGAQDLVDTSPLGRRAMGAYCPGVAGMGRQEAISTANSEIFFMRDAARRLDGGYTVWGRVVKGLDVVRAMTVGEPPADPDTMIRVRVASDLPIAERPRLEVMDEGGRAFRRLAAKIRAAKGADFTVCDIEVPIR